MTEIRGEVFKEVDATSLDDHDSYDIHVGESPEDVTSLTVEFEQFEADSVSELEAKLDERAEVALDASEADRSENTGYEVVKEYGDTSRTCGFVVVSPHL